MTGLTHSYTNDTRRSGGVVVKHHLGPGAARRRDTEALALRAAAGSVPVPALLDPEPGADGRGSEGLGGTVPPLRTAFVEAVHAKDLWARGCAEQVMAACGRVLRLVHALDPALLPGPGPLPGQVFVHGDFGPNNVLMEPCGGRVAAVLDWEWAHPGAPVEDLAWCEWVVRTYHPGEVGALEAFFAAYGLRPAWAERHAWMVRRCEEVAAFWEEWRPLSPTTGVRRAQSAATRAWRG
ncbi:phosphotransferase [Nocardiopsis sp. NPDC006198]|uniref:phosphotransferase family protein n=1 Tax=Nocardiopsis sp. NPDC006198 TaxID=3154472 RepID=UPI0033B5355F